MYSKTTFAAAWLSVAGLVASQDAAPKGSATVDLSKQVGEATHLGSGFIYGFPDNGVEADTSIPAELVTGMGFRACRAGGAQLPAPASGWAIGGYDGYIGRFESTLSNYLTTRKYGGDLILLPHDLWGADGSLNGLYPGDDGDWSEMEKFWDQLIKDLKEHDMLEGLVIDIWNEPDINQFWPRSWDQYLEYYVRANKIVREQLPGTLVSGPSSGNAPAPGNDQWERWLEAISKNDATPDIYAWHQIGDDNRQPDRVMPDWINLLAKYNLPERPIDINEYAWPEAQNPANTVWYLAQFERHDWRGLRAHWGSGRELHDLMADLVFHADGTYRPNGEWYLYEYYTQMKGSRVETAASDDLVLDVFGVVSGDGAKIIAGTRTVQAPYEIAVTGLSALGLPEEGSTQVRTLQFDWAGKGTDTGPPKDLGTTEIQYSGGKLVIPVNPPTDSTAYAFEILKAAS